MVHIVVKMATGKITDDFFIIIKYSDLGRKTSFRRKLKK